VRVRLPYGKTEAVVDFREGLNLRVVESRQPNALPDQIGTVRDALRHPIAAAPLREQVKSPDTVGIVVNDITRPTPYKIILPALLAELSHVPDEQIVILVATGTHRSNTPAELRTMLGDAAVHRFRVVQNDVGDPNAHAPAGVTGQGHEAWLHKEYLACDFRILTGFIEPHFFAGLSGGGKVCMPGLASLATILRNHRPENIDHPGATWGITDGNPLWEEIQEVASMVEPTFLLNVALDTDSRITGVFAGDLVQAHEQGRAFVRQHTTVSVGAPFDIVITSNSGHPLDLNLYQAVKGMSVAARIVKDDGAIIVAADCWDGIPDHGEYRRLLFEAASPTALLADIRSASVGLPDTWQAQIHALVCRSAHVYLYSHNLTDEQIERAMLKPCRDVARTVDYLLESYGSGASVCVLPAGPQAIPYVHPSQGIE
jgi:nickel-dependent lactate racemase